MGSGKAFAEVIEFDGVGVAGNPDGVRIESLQDRLNNPANRMVTEICGHKTHAKGSVHVPSVEVIALGNCSREFPGPGFVFDPEGRSVQIGTPNQAEKQIGMVGCALGIEGDGPTSNFDGVVEEPLQTPRAREPRIRRRVQRPPADDGIVLRSGLLVEFGFLKTKGQIPRRLQPIRRDIGCTPERCDGIVGSMAGEKRGPESIEMIGVLRTQRHRGLRGGARVFRATKRQQGNCKIAVNGGIIRKKAHRACAHIRRIFRAVRPAIRHAEIDQDLRRFRCDIGRTLQLLNSFVDTPHHQKRGTEIRRNSRVVFACLHGLLEAGDCFFRQAGLKPENADKVVRLAVFWVQLENLPIETFRRRRLSASVQLQAFVKHRPDIIHGAVIGTGPTGCKRRQSRRQLDIASKTGTECRRISGYKMEPLVYFIKGAAAGFAIAAPVGAVAVLCIRRTIANGLISGIATGTGAAVADMFYGVIAAFGIGFVAEFLYEHQVAFRAVGGIILLVMAARMLRTMQPEQGSGDAGSIAGDFLSALVVTITNPITLIAFGVVFAAIGVANASDDRNLELALVTGVLAGAMGWWLSLSTLTAFCHRFIGDFPLLWVNRVSAALILVCGVLVLAGAVAPDSTLGRLTALPD